MSIHIRLAQSSDIETIFEIRTAVKENHLTREQLDAKGITPSAIQTLVAAQNCVWVAEERGQSSQNGSINGFAMADLDEGAIFALFVLPDKESRGIGRRLMQEAEAALFQSHFVLWLETDSVSRAARFYEKLGWKVTAELPKGDVRMEKNLA